MPLDLTPPASFVDVTISDSKPKTVTVAPEEGYLWTDATGDNLYLKDFWIEKIVKEDDTELAFGKTSAYARPGWIEGKLTGGPDGYNLLLTYNEAKMPYAEVKSIVLGHTVTDHITDVDGAVWISPTTYDSNGVKGAEVLFAVDNLNNGQVYFLDIRDPAAAVNGTLHTFGVNHDPYDIAVDSDGNIYTAGRTDNSVWKGTYNGGDPASSGSYTWAVLYVAANGVWGVAVNDDYVFLSMFDLDRVTRINKDGTGATNIVTGASADQAWFMSANNDYLYFKRGSGVARCNPDGSGLIGIGAADAESIALMPDGRVVIGNGLDIAILEADGSGEVEFSADNVDLLATDALGNIYSIYSLYDGETVTNFSATFPVTVLKAIAAV